VSPLALDLEAMQVRLNGRLLAPPLSPLEWKLLVLLYQHAGKVCMRDAIFEALYDAPDMTDIPLDTALETLVSRLRKRLNMVDSRRLPYIRAVRGAGYRLEL
jgi:DNA-binding response OmpR family regulator